MVYSVIGEDCTCKLTFINMFGFFLNVNDGTYKTLYGILRLNVTRSEPTMSTPKFKCKMNWKH